MMMKLFGRCYELCVVIKKYFSTNLYRAIGNWCDQEGFHCYILLDFWRSYPALSVVEF
jgi:hypothetical protein